MTWTTPDLVSAIQRYALENGTAPLHDDWSKGDRPPYAPTSSTVARRFGSWDAGLQAAGLTPTPEWTQGAVITAMQRWAAEHGEPPLFTDWSRRGKPDAVPGSTT